MSIPIQIDLGTAFTKVTVGRKILKPIPTVLGLRLKDDRLQTVIGESARRAPFRPSPLLKNGIVTDYENLRRFIRVLKKNIQRELSLSQRLLGRVHYLFLFHADLTDQEETFIREAIAAANVSSFAIKNTNCTFYGRNQIILDLGAGVNSAMLFQENELVATASEYFGGDDLTAAIHADLSKRLCCNVGTRNAEYLKMTDCPQQWVRGLELTRKTPVKVVVRHAELQPLRQAYALRVAQLIQRLYHANPTVKISEIALAGGMAALPQLAQMIEAEIHVPCKWMNKSTSINILPKEL